MNGDTNHQIRLAARPVGLPKRSNWQFTETPVPEERFPEMLLKLFSGENFGKLVLKVA